MEFKIHACFIRPGYTDMRRGMNGLMNTVVGEMDLPLNTGDLYIFCGKNKSSLKMLYWAKDSFWLFQKVLHDTNFSWPMSELDALLISEKELEMLLNGIDFWRSHPVIRAEKRLRKLG